MHVPCSAALSAFKHIQYENMFSEKIMTDLVNSMLIIAIATDWRRCLDPDNLEIRCRIAHAPQTITASN